MWRFSGRGWKVRKIALSAKPKNQELQFFCNRKECMSAQEIISLFSASKKDLLLVLTLIQEIGEKDTIQFLQEYWKE